MNLHQLLGTAIAHPTESAAQLEKIRCEGSLLEFVKAGWHALEPGTEFLHGWAVEAMAEALERVTNGDIRRLLINVPPGCTKSMLVNVFWPAWEWGPKSKADYRYINVESDVVRERALRWFFETLSSRYNKLDESAMVVIMQRVHDRDLSGAIIAKMAEGKLKYEHLCLPMEFESDHPHKSTRFVDPRTEDGELLWPERFSPNAVDEQKETFRAWGGTYAEAGQLQQRPVPRGGGMFKRDDIEVLDGIPAHATVVARARGWDLAATDSSRAAYTVGCKIAKLADGRIVIEDVVRGRWGPAEVEAKLLACANVDGPGIVQFIPQDPGQAGKSQVRAFAAMLEGHNARFSPESGDKETRAIPIAAQAEAGNLAMVRAPWNDALLAEMTLFPAGQFKDQVDALTRAYDWLLQNRAPAIATVPGRMIEK